MQRSIFHFPFSIFLLLAPVIAFAQESETDKIDVKADVIEYLEQGRLVSGKGNVVATYKGIRLETDEVSIQVDTKIAICKGKATVYQNGITYEGENLIYDFEKQSGQAVNAKVKVPPLYGGGEKVIQKSPGEFEVENGYLTTCDHQPPHYKVTTKHITIQQEKVIAHNAVIWAGPIPVLYIPSYSHSIKSKRPKVSTLGGHRKEWGAFLLTSWNYEVGSGFKGDFLLDERDNLGLGYGTTFDYRTGSFGEGRSKAYYTQERRRDLGEGVPAEKERYQLSLQHAWKISDRTAAFFEFNKRSDASFVKDYFEREYEKESNPETHLDLIHHHPVGSGEIYVRERANRFENVTERLPELRWHLNSLSVLGSPAYFTSDTQLISFEKKDAKSKTSDDVFRSDLLNQLEIPFQARRWLNVDPYVGVRQTIYSRGRLRKDTLTRGIFLGGVHLNTRLAKIYPGGLPLRHVMTPQLHYEYLASPTVDKKLFFNMGDVDILDRTSRLTLSLEQKWQSKQIAKDGSTNIKDLARLLVTNQYDFETPRGGEFSLLSADLELRPKAAMAIDVDVSYDPPSKDLLQFNLDLRLEPPGETKWVFGHRYLQNSSTQETFEIATQLGSKWKLRVYERFNIKSFRENRSKVINNFLEQEYTLIRDLHCWEAEINYNVESGEEIWIVFRLKGLEDLPYSLKQKSYSPSGGPG